jgi:hypothetical protein
VLGPNCQQEWHTYERGLTVCAEGGVAVKVTTRVNGVELVVCTEDVGQLDSGGTVCQISVDTRSTVSTDRITSGARVAGTEELASIALGVSSDMNSRLNALTRLIGLRCWAHWR